jgi:Holliday junction DNA helicase RuvB
VAKYKPNSKKALYMKTDSKFLDQTLRPNNWDEYIGQNSIKQNIHILLTAAKERGESAEHMLFYGPPGLGKTTIAHLIAKETGRNITVTSGPAIEKIGDLASILTNLAPHDILFIDEIHRLSKLVEEILYPAMESGVMDIMIGKGPSARSVQLELPPFTLIGATTRISLLSAPLRSRFGGGVFRLEYYSHDELAKILERSAKIIEVDMDAGGIDEIVKRSRKTPRAANYFLKRVRDYGQVKNMPLDKNTADLALSMLGIDKLGLNQIDREYLKTLLHKFKGGPTGLSTLAVSLHEDEGTIEDVVEPYLLSLGFIERTPRGRTITDMGIEHINE